MSVGDLDIIFSANPSFYLFFIKVQFAVFFVLLFSYVPQQTQQQLQNPSGKLLETQQTWKPMKHLIPKKNAPKRLKLLRKKSNKEKSDQLKKERGLNE